MPTDGDTPPPEAADADLESVLERLSRVEAERDQLRTSLEHEAEANRRILEAHGVAEGRVAEIEGVLAGTEAVRARAEAERDELQRRLTVALAARKQQHDEDAGAAEHRARALAEQLEAQAREADEQRAEHDRARAADAERIAELEGRLAEELARAADRTEALQAEVKDARGDMRPRAARKLGDAQAALEAERAARAQLELQVVALTEAQRALEQARAQESEAAGARIAEIEPALEEARTASQSALRELDGLSDRLAASEARLLEVEAERDDAVGRAGELARRLAEAEDASGVLERALDAVSVERDRTETARLLLEARLSTREESERAALAERELERHTARAQRVQLTRVERRMAEISSGLGIAMRRLEIPLPAGVEAEAPAPQPAGVEAEAPAPQPAGVEAEAPAPQPAAVPEPAAVAEADPPPAEPDPEPDPEQAPEAAPIARTLVSGFLRSAERFPGRPALEVAGEAYDFAALHGQAACIAATLQRHAPSAGPPLTGVFAHRSATAFAGVLGALMRGHGYVPLKRTLPVERTCLMLELAGCEAIVVDSGSVAQLPELLGDATKAMLVLVPDAEDVGELRSALPAHHVLGAAELEPAASWQAVEVDPSAIAYLLFTSAAGGVPTGVPVTHGSALHHVDALADRYVVDEHDRFSQLHDLTFDNSVFDLFVAWERGACVCCPGQPALLNPGRHMRDARLTVWFSLPSVAMFMRRLGDLEPDSYPDLRCSLFGGEPLPLEVARAWEQAAPRSGIENLYGPAETTPGVLLYRWDAQTSAAQCERAILPIGHPLAGVGVLIADEALREVGPGEQGELLLCGPQLSPGYWGDPERTAAAFVTPPGSDAVHYRTGDLVRRPRETGGPIVLLGRRDDEVRIRGERVQLGEIESALRDASGIDAVAALGWPATLVGADGVEAFVGSADVDVAAVRAALGERLPGHIVPRRVRALPELPLNAGGAIDRAALVRLLESE